MMKFKEILLQDPNIYPDYVEEVDRQLIELYFNERIVNDDVLFKDYFRRALFTYYKQYKKLVALDPSIKASYDFLIEHYNETQTKGTGSTNSTADNTAETNTTNTLNTKAKTTGKNTTDITNNTDNTTTLGSKHTTTDTTNNKTTESGTTKAFTKNEENSITGVKALPMDSSNVVKVTPADNKTEPTTGNISRSSVDTLKLVEIPAATSITETGGASAGNNHNYTKNEVTTNGGGSSTTQGSGTDTTNSKTIGKNTSDINSTVDNTGTVTTNTDNTGNSKTTSSNNNTVQTISRGRSTKISSLLSDAFNLIRYNNSYLFLIDKLDPCFLAIYDY